MTTLTRLLTAEDLLALPDDGKRYELARGELREMSTEGEDHTLIALNIASSLLVYVRAHDLGRAYGSGGTFILHRNPDTVRVPDVAFVRKERFEATGRLRTYRPGAPDLAVEVNSPNDRPDEVILKVLEYLAAGTQMVVVVDPPLQTVAVYRSPTDVTVLTLADTLDGADVVPGWQMPVREMFA